MLSTMLIWRTWRRMSRQTAKLKSMVSATLNTKLRGAMELMNIIWSISTVRMMNWCRGMPTTRPTREPMRESRSISRKM